MGFIFNAGALFYLRFSAFFIFFRHFSNFLYPHSIPVDPPSHGNAMRFNAFLTYQTANFRNFTFNIRKSLAYSFA